MAKRRTPEVSYAPGADWCMVRGKKLLSAWKVKDRVAIGCWKEIPRKRGDLPWWKDGQEMQLTPEEALDLAYALGFMAHEMDPDVKEKHRRWTARGRRRAPALKLIRGGGVRVHRDKGTPER